MSSGLQLLLAASSFNTDVAASGGGSDGTDGARKVAVAAGSSFLRSICVVTLVLTFSALGSVCKVSCRCCWEKVICHIVTRGSGRLDEPRS